MKKIVLIRIIFGIWTAELFKGCVAPPETGAYNLIYTAFPPHHEQYVYKFNGEFEDHRIEQLLNIAKENGSVQASDTLKYDEYESLMKGNVPSALVKIIDQFKRRANRLAKKISEFAKKSFNAFEKYKDIDSFKVLFLMAEKEALREYQETTKQTKHFPFHELVMNCKQFMKKVMSEEGVITGEWGEGSWIDVFSFMDSKNTVYSMLKTIWELSTIQSHALDEMIIVSMWTEHSKNQQPGKKVKRTVTRTVIEGAGPIGLYAAFHLFLAGQNVTVVNDRSEEYIRNRAFFLDAKWMTQLRFFLGTKFDQLFVDNRAPARINLVEVGQLNCKNLEDVLKQRLRELIIFIREKVDAASESLELLYNTKFSGIEAPTKTNKHFEAKLGHEPGVQRRSFDVLLCAGGANDRIRDQQLGPSMPLTLPKNFGIVVFEKGKFVEKIFDDQTVFYKEPMDSMPEILAKYNLEEVIRKSTILSKRLKMRYAHLNELIVKGLVKKEESKKPTGEATMKDEHVTDENGQLISGSDLQKLFVRLFENRPTLHIASVTPIALAEFLDELNQERTEIINKVLQNATEVSSDHEQSQENHAKKVKKAYKDVQALIERKWSAAIYEFCLGKTHPEKVDQIKLNIDEHGNPREFNAEMLNFDPHDVNTSTFPLIIYAVGNAVKELKSEHGSAIVVAIGDANTNGHFMTASGLSTGRMGIEWTANLLKLYNNGHLKKRSELMANLTRKLNSIKDLVLKKVREQTNMVIIEDAKENKVGLNGADKNA